jgi:uncharacterized membrane protein
MAWIVAYFASALTMGVLDYIWLTNSKPMYQRALGSALAENPDMRAAVVFYVLYLVGVMIFAVRPALASGDWRQATLFGALFGFFAYATYDLTNLATLKTFTLQATLADLAWGTFITAAAGTAGALAALKLLR